MNFDKKSKSKTFFFFFFFFLGGGGGGGGGGSGDAGARDSAIVQLSCGHVGIDRMTMQDDNPNKGYFWVWG